MMFALHGAGDTLTMCVFHVFLLHHECDECVIQSITQAQKARELVCFTPTLIETMSWFFGLYALCLRRLNDLATVEVRVCFEQSCVVNFTLHCNECSSINGIRTVFEELRFTSYINSPNTLVANKRTVSCTRTEPHQYYIFPDFSDPEFCQPPPPPLTHNVQPVLYNLYAVKLYRPPPQH